MNKEFFNFYHRDKDIIPELYYKNIDINIDTKYNKELITLKKELNKIIKYKLEDKDYNIDGYELLNEDIKHNIKIYLNLNKDCKKLEINYNQEEKYDIKQVILNIENNIDKINNLIFESVIKNYINGPLNIITLINNNIEIFYERLYWMTLLNLVMNIDDKSSCDIIDELNQFLNVDHTSKNHFINNFEVFSSKFIRNDQIKIINKILEENKDSKELGIHEFLMGKGKTAVITPLLILEKYYYKKPGFIYLNDESQYAVKHRQFLNLNNSRENTGQEYMEQEYIKYFIIVLPNDNLVQQSKKILKILEQYQFQISELFDEDTENNIYINDEKIVFILSSSKFKKILINLENIENTKKIFENSFFIFDEFDSLYDPLKSELNIIDNFGDSNKSKKLENYYNDILDYLFNFILSHETFIDEVKNNFREDFTNKFSDIDNINLLTNEIIYGLKQIYNPNFNINEKYGRSYKNKKSILIIPYKNAKNPNEGSEFSSYIMTILLTINYFKKNNLNRYDWENIYNLFHKL